MYYHRMETGLILQQLGIEDRLLGSQITKIILIRI